VVRSYRRRGLATLLLTRAFRTIHQQGKTEVTAEVDDADAASRSLLLRLGARRKAGFLELVKRQRTRLSRCLSDHEQAVYRIMNSQR
jgi:RimJ/RimL family protein N-acetyltransferase